VKKQPKNYRVQPKVKEMATRKTGKALGLSTGTCKSRKKEKRKKEPGETEEGKKKGIREVTRRRGDVGVIG